MSALVFDIEANGLLDEVDKAWCVCTKDLDTGDKTSWDIRQEKQSNAMHFDQAIKKNLFEPANEIIGHNIIGYDLQLIKKLTGLEPNEDTKITDTLVMSRLANPDRLLPIGYEGKGGPHSLGAWGYRVSKAKPDHEEWGVFSTAMLRRCKSDVDINALIVPVLREELSDFSQESIDLEHRTAQIISAQEVRGIYFDLDKANEYVQWLTDRIADIDARIVPSLPKELIVGTPILNPFLNSGGYRQTVRKYMEESGIQEGQIGGPFTRVSFKEFDLGSIAKVKEYLLSSGWVPDNWNFSNTTGERTSPKLEGAFDGVDGEVPLAVKERITWRHRRSQIEGLIKNVREDGSIPAGATPCGTNTNRMRHHKVVNLPKANADKKTGELIWDTDLQSDIFGTQIRSLFIPRPGFKIVGHDASGLELRMLAHYLGVQSFIDEILSGDIHSFNQKMAGLETRDQAKTFIYALIYGAGDWKIGSIIGGDDIDGKEIKRKYFDSLPELEKFIEAVKRSSAKGWLRGLDGRRIYMRKDSRGRVERKKAPNTLLQSAGTIVVKRSCAILWDDVAANDIEAYKILDMHDEGQSEVRDDPNQIERYCDIAVNSVIKAGRYYNLKIPLDAEAKVGMNLAETH